MSFSDCEKCWMTLCRCGYEYETLRTEDVKEIRDKLNELLERRRQGELVRRPPDTVIHNPGQYAQGFRIPHSEVSNKFKDMIEDFLRQ